MRSKFCVLFMTGVVAAVILYGCGETAANEGASANAFSVAATTDEGSDTDGETYAAVEVEEDTVVEQYMVNGHEASKEEYERQKALDNLEEPGQIADRYDDIDDVYTDVEDLRNADGTGKIIYHYGEGVTITYEKIGDAVNISKEEPAK